jgi:Holliday junction resolvasome RuvABC endonuclease subunit
METTVAYTLAPAYVAAPVILGLDASSTNVGWVVLDGTIVRDHGEIRLSHPDISERCRLARAGVGLVLRCHADIDAAAIETPVNRFAKATIPQCFVQGAVRSLLAELGILVCDVTPSQAKRALCDRGDASKAAMQQAAAARGVVGEHAADALGVALAGLGKVEVTRG